MLSRCRCEAGWNNGGVLRVAAVVEQCWHRVPGGTATATVRTLRAVAARGDVQVIGVSAAHRRPPSLPIPSEIPVRSVPLPRRALYDAWNYARRPALRGPAGRCDVVHATGGVVPPARGAGLVATVYDLAFLREPAWFTRRGRRFATRALRVVRAHADVVVAPSQATAQDCARVGIGSQRLRVVPLGVHTARATRQQVETVRALYRLPDTFALWVGTAEPRKNIAGLLAAAARTASEVPLVLAGPPGWGVDVSSLLEACPATAVHLGYVRDGDLGALYAAARVFVYPSWMEGFGLPVLEAMAQGTPVVTSSGTATEEVCADASSVVDPADPEALAAAIDLVVTDDSEHRRRSAAARRRAAQLTWEQTAAGVTAAYRDACR